MHWAKQMPTRRTTLELLVSVVLCLGAGCVGPRYKCPIPAGAVAREVMPDTDGKRKGYRGAVGQDVTLVEYWVDGEKVGERQWDSGGNLVYEAGFRHGKLHGCESYWGDGGALQGCMGFLDGQPDGWYTKWYENGTKEHEVLLKRGCRQGTERWWGYDGQLWRETHWRDDARHGEDTEWYENGRKAREFTYRYGERHGSSAWWWKDGSLKALIQCREGNPVLLTCPGARMYSYVITGPGGGMMGQGYLAMPAELKVGRDNEGFFTFQLADSLADSDCKEVETLTAFLGRYAGGRMVLKHSAQPDFIGETTTVLKLNPGVCDANIDFLVRESPEGLTGIWLWGDFSGGGIGGQLRATPCREESREKAEQGNGLER